MSSAGVGRTGTFIAIDNILEQIGEQKSVDIPRAITKIRQRRMKMVQTHVRHTNYRLTL
jgi:protein tyrosine phosphatase